MSSVVTSAIFFFFFFNDTATTEIYTLSLHDALPIYNSCRIALLQLTQVLRPMHGAVAGKMPALWPGWCSAMRIGLITICPRPWMRSEEHTSELQSQSNLVCRLLLGKKKKKKYYVLCSYFCYLFFFFF